MRIVVKKVGQIGEIMEVENTLDTFQEIVGGYIETYPIMTDTLIVCNEEGKLMGLEPNVIIQVGQHKEVVNGNFAIVKQGEEDFESLDDKQIEILRNSGLIK